MSQQQTTRPDAPTDDPTPDVEADPSRLILPYVDSSMKLYKGLNVEELALLLPAALLAVATAWAFLFVGRPLGFALLVMTFAAVSVGKWAIKTTEWYDVPRERVRNRLALRQLRRSLPWGHEAAMDAPGLRRVGREGSVQRRDGRWLALVRIDECSADRLTDASMTATMQALRQGIDTNLEKTHWSYYQTTRPSTTADLAAHREARAESDDTLTPLQRETLSDAATWLRDQDGFDGPADARAWQANETRHYIVVEAHRFEANVNPLGASMLDALPGGLRERLTRLPGVADPDQPNTDGLAVGDGRDVRETLSARVSDVCAALSGVSGLSARRASRREHVDVAHAYWSGDDRHVPEHRLGDPLFRAYEHDADETGYSPMERMVAPDLYDVRDRTVHLGERVARTFWIAEWPLKPGGMFLRDLSALTGVDVDVTLYCEPYPTAQADLEHLVPEVDAERMDRMDRGDISSMSVEDIEEAYSLAYLVLDHTNVTPWRLNGYLTVRADSVEQLDADCERVVRTLKDHPANCSLVASGTRQHEQFAAGCPFGGDEFDGVTSQPKSRIALSGGLAAALSPVAPRLQE